MSPIVLIVGAKAPNATALLVWMILACLQCIVMICLAIYGLVVGAAVGVAVATSDDLKVEGNLNPGLFIPKLQPQTFQPRTFQP